MEKNVEKIVVDHAVNPSYDEYPRGTYIRKSCELGAEYVHPSWRINTKDDAEMEDDRQSVKQEIANILKLLTLKQLKELRDSLLQK